MAFGTSTTSSLDQTKDFISGVTLAMIWLSQDRL